MLEKATLHAYCLANNAHAFALIGPIREENNEKRRSHLSTQLVLDIRLVPLRVREGSINFNLTFLTFPLTFRL